MTTYYLVNVYELNSSALVNVIAKSNNPVKLNAGKKDNEVIISANLLCKMGKYAWIEM